jgi:phosphatidylserine decarboxylase
MKHAGKARQAGLRIIVFSLILLIALGGMGWLATLVGSLIKVIFSGLVVIWALFVAFTLYFFRDPEARPPQGTGLVVSPAHGTVDVIDEIDDPDVVKGRCRRISIFLSVFDVHVQQSPVTGRVTLVRHTPGEFLNAINADCAKFNENVLVAFEPNDAPGVQIGVRLIAGLIARRIIPWIQEGETVVQGQRISLIQFGSRSDIYLPLNYQVQVKLGDKVRGGETTLAAAK